MQDYQPMSKRTPQTHQIHVAYTQSVHACTWFTITVSRAESLHLGLYYIKGRHDWVIIKNGEDSVLCTHGHYTTPHTPHLCMDTPEMTFSVLLTSA